MIASTRDFTDEVMECERTLPSVMSEDSCCRWREIAQQRGRISRVHRGSRERPPSIPSASHSSVSNGSCCTSLTRRRRTFMTLTCLVILAAGVVVAAAATDGQHEQGKGMARLGPSLKRGPPRRRQPGQHARDLTFFKPLKSSNETASSAQRSAPTMIDGGSARADNANLHNPIRRMPRRRLNKPNEMNGDRTGTRQEINNNIRSIRRQRLGLRQQSAAKAGAGSRFPAYKFASTFANGSKSEAGDLLDDADVVDSSAAVLNTLDADEDPRHGGPPAFLTRIRRDKDGVSPPPETITVPHAVLQTTTAASHVLTNDSLSHKINNESSSSTVAATTSVTIVEAPTTNHTGQDGGHDGHPRTVLVDGEAENSTGEGGTYTSIDSPPDKVKVANIGPFGFQLRWQRLAHDPGHPVTFVAELTFVESPGCSGDECAGNFSSVPNPQVITRENSTFQDQQWVIGKNRRLDQGAIRPYSKYKVRLRRKIGESEGQFSPEVDVFTPPSVPDRPQNVTLTPVNGEIHVAWGNPKLYPGPMNYSIHVLLWDGCPDIPNVHCDCKKTKAGNDKIVLQVTADEQVKKSKVLGRSQCVLNGSAYMVQVQASTTAGAGPLSFPQNITTNTDGREVTGPVVAGENKSADIVSVPNGSTEGPTVVNNLTATCGSGNMKLRWDPPETTHGMLTAYEIRVDKLKSELVDGSDQQTSLVFGPFLLNLSAPCQMPSPSPGEPEYHRGSPCAPHDYSVAGLEPGFAYEASVLAVLETGVKGPASTARCSLDDKTAEHLEDPSNGALIGGIIGGILAVVILCALAFFVWRRVAAPAMGMNEPMKMHLSRMGNRTSSESSSNNNQLGYARAKPTQPARPSIFSNDKEVKANKGQDNLAHEVDDIYEIRRKLDSDEVREEFDLICSQGPKLDANERAFARTSLSKNRFVNVLPFERTRVRLVGVDNDYINASYVKGENHEREYIATQAPKMETIRDFWWMVWQEEVATIAMIAQGTKGLSEDQLPPGFQYWPKLEVPMKFDSLTVYKMEDNSMRTGSGKHTVRIFVLEKGTETRSVTQVQFEEWPTVGVPEDTRQINDYVVAVRQQNDYHVKASGQKPPLLVHCSAGTGRTGVAIALDRLRHQYKQKKAVDIPGTVHDLRHCRVHLVQTPEQYAFLYRCVVQMMEDVSNPADVNND